VFLALFTATAPGVRAATDQTITFTSTPVSPVVGGPTYTVAAAGGGSGNPVTFAIDPTSAGVCSISDSTVSFATAGTCVIDANQTGDGTNYNPAPQVQQSFAVGRGSQTITFTSTAPSPVTVGGATYTPTATGGASSNPVVITIAAAASSVCSIDGTGVVSFIAAGPCLIDANQAGDTNYDPALQVQQSVTVGTPSLTTQTITFTSSAPGSATVGGTTYTPTATASSGLAVAITIDATASSVCSISAGVVSFIGPGACLIDANQAGNATYAAAPQVQQSITVGTPSPTSQTITFTSTAPGSATVGGPPYTPTATGGASGNPVILTIGSAASSVCSISAGVVSFIGTGTCVIDANQAGNGTWAAAAQVQQSFTVGTNVISPPGTLSTVTVTAEPKSRPFGTPNPALTAVISGVAPGQTPATSGITGIPLCTTTATLFSPAGTYPITCGIGTLASVAHVFTFVPATLTVLHGASSVTLSTTTTVFETSTPVTWTAAVEPEVSGALPTGGLVFSVDGIAQPAVPLDKNGRGSVTVRWSTPGRKSVAVSYAGDASFAATGTASTAPSVVANTARATGVGLSATAFSPIVDGWRDTVTARGTRLEPLSVAIIVKDAQGNVVRTQTFRTAAGPYAWAWNGRRSDGSALPAGRYTIVQSLNDPYGSHPRAVRTSSVVLSLREITWSTTTITAVPGPRCFGFSSGDGVGSYSCSSSAPLRLAAAAGHWPGVGFEFRLPSATAYRSIRVEVEGTSTGRQPTVGFHDWTLGLAWGQLYQPDWRSTAISPTGTRWAGVTTVDTARFISGRTVRVYVEGGGRLAGPFAFTVTGVRLIVSVGTAQ
jgi:hypothetical protein